MSNTPEELARERYYAAVERVRYFREAYATAGVAALHYTDVALSNAREELREATRAWGEARKGNVSSGPLKALSEKGKRP